MKIIHRYLLREAAIFFTITLLAFTAVLLTVRMLRFASLIVNKGVDFSQIVEVFISIIPTFLELAIPMAALLGVMLSIARLSGDSEIIVMRASGLSIFQLAPPILIFGLVALAASLVTTIYLKPWGAQNLSRILFEIARSKSTSGLNEGIFNPLGDITLYAEKIDFLSGKMQRVLVDDRRDKAQRRIIIAAKGDLSSDPAQQTINFALEDGEIHEVSPRSRYVVTQFTNNTLAIPFEQIEASARNKDPAPREYTLDALRAEIVRLQQIKPDVQHADPSRSVAPSRRLVKLRTELGSRFSMPCASLIFSLIGLTLGIVPPRAQRTWGAGLSLLLGMLVFMLYYGVLTAGITLAEGGSIPHTLGLWLPNLISALIAVWLLWKIGNERWTSVADLLPSNLTQKLRKHRDAKAA